MYLLVYKDRNILKDDFKIEKYKTYIDKMIEMKKINRK